MHDITDIGVVESSIKAWSVDQNLALASNPTINDVHVLSFLQLSMIYRSLELLRHQCTQLLCPAEDQHPIPLPIIWNVLLDIIDSSSNHCVLVLNLNKAVGNLRPAAILLNDFPGHTSSLLEVGYLARRHTRAEVDNRYLELKQLMEPVEVLPISMLGKVEVDFIEYHTLDTFFMGKFLYMSKINQNDKLLRKKSTH